MQELYDRRQAALERYRIQYELEHGPATPMILSEGEGEDEIDGPTTKTVKPLIAVCDCSRKRGAVRSPITTTHVAPVAPAKIMCRQPTPSTNSEWRTDC